MTTERNETWLAVGEAARRLGVHPVTLRRWADQGDIPVVVTPGGHRRFAAADIAAFSRERRLATATRGLEQILTQRALVNTRSEIVARDQPWLSAFDEQDRQAKRLLGRQLMGLLLQYISMDGGGEGLLAEARSIARIYAGNALELGLPITQTLEAAIFFRDTILETALTLPDQASVPAEANRRLLRRINRMLNEVQLAVAEAYEDADRG